MDAKKVMDILDKDKVIEILSELGSEVYKENEDHIIFTETICHGGRHKNKLYYYIDSKAFYCYTNCGKLNIFELIMKAKGVKFYDAYKYVKKRINKYAPRNGFYEEKKYDMENTKIETLPIIDKPFLYKMFTDNIVEDWTKEDITAAAMQKFCIGYDSKLSRAIIPHFDRKGNVVGIRVRNFKNTDDKAKYMPLFYNNICYSHPLGKNLYGLNISKENIKNKKRCIVFEGEKSVLKYESYFPNNNISVAICGSSFSSMQKKMLLDLGVEEIVLALDKQFEDVNSEEAADWKNKILKNARYLTDSCKVSYIWDDKGLLEYKDSPIDQGYKKFRKLLNKRLYINGEM